MRREIRRNVIFLLLHLIFIVGIIIDTVIVVPYQKMVKIYGNIQTMRRSRAIRKFMQYQLPSGVSSHPSIPDLCVEVRKKV